MNAAKGISIWVLICIVFWIIAGCAITPKQFELGEEVAPPRGCLELRERGGDC